MYPSLTVYDYLGPVDFTSSWSFNLPIIADNEGLLLIGTSGRPEFGSPGITMGTSGWTQISAWSSSTSYSGYCIFWKRLGSAGDTGLLVQGTLGNPGYWAFKLVVAAAGTWVEDLDGINGYVRTRVVTANVTCNSYTAPWGIDDNAWGGVAGMGPNKRSMVSYPADYPLHRSNITTPGAAGAAHNLWMAVANKQTSEESPGVFALSASEPNLGGTWVIRGTPGVGPTFQPAWAKQSTIGDGYAHV